MSKTNFFGVDPETTYSALPSVSTGLSYYDVQRQRLVKFAKQYLVIPAKPIKTLNSQGQTDTEDPSVIATRESFSQIRRDIAVLNQFYEYSNDPVVLSKIKDICLSWARVNIPDGKPINETNFEALIRVMTLRYDDFSTSEKQEINDWVDSLIAARESWDFTQQPGEGTLTYGNHYTHHYKILMQCYTLRGLQTKINSLQLEMDTFITENFPFGNSNIYYPQQQNIISMSSGSNTIQILGDRTYVYRAGFDFWVNGTPSNDRKYNVSVDSTYDGTYTNIIVSETISSDVISTGIISEVFFEPYHDMPREATSSGESIDYIRRDAIHYHMYDLLPWLEIDLLTNPIGKYRNELDLAWQFYVNNLLTTDKHYEFLNSSDTFDGLRFTSSKSEYLQPYSKFKPGRSVGLVLTYFYYKNKILGAENYTEDSYLVNMAQRLSAEHLAQFWDKHFRWCLGLGENL